MSPSAAADDSVPGWEGCPMVVSSGEDSGERFSVSAFVTKLSVAGESFTDASCDEDVGIEVSCFTATSTAPCEGCVVAPGDPSCVGVAGDVVGDDETPTSFPVGINSSVSMPSRGAGKIGRAHVGERDLKGRAGDDRCEMYAPSTALLRFMERSGIFSALSLSLSSRWCCIGETRLRFTGLLDRVSAFHGGSCGFVARALDLVCFQRILAYLST